MTAQSCAVYNAGKSLAVSQCNTTSHHCVYLMLRATPISIALMGMMKSSHYCVEGRGAAFAAPRYCIGSMATTRIGLGCSIFTFLQDKLS
jgi:hypothetical protein